MYSRSYDIEINHLFCTYWVLCSLESIIHTHRVHSTKFTTIDEDNLNDDDNYNEKEEEKDDDDTVRVAGNKDISMHMHVFVFTKCSF